MSFSEKRKKVMIDQEPYNNRMRSDQNVRWAPILTADAGRYVFI